MSTQYDPQYSTKVSFNTPILQTMLGKSDLELVKHWLENGEPNKNLAAVALRHFINHNWIEALNILWDSNWLTKKVFLNKGWDFLASPHRVGSHHPLKESLSEQWLINKTFNEKILTANEINNLSIAVLNMNLLSSNDYYWNMFFVDTLKLKGKTVENMLHVFMLYAYEFDSKAISQEVMYKRMHQIVDHKNGFSASYHDVVTTVLKHADFDLFWKMLNKKIDMSKHDLFLVAALMSMYFRVVGQMSLKHTREQVEENITNLMKCLVRLGLPEKVVFNYDDITKKYEKIFKQGHISLANTNVFKSGLTSETIAYHLDSWDGRPYVPYANRNDDPLVLYAGDAFFAIPSTDRFKGGYKRMTPEQQQDCRDAFLIQKKA